VKKTFLLFALLFPFLFISSNSVSQEYLNFPIDTIVRDSFYNYRSMIKFDAAGFIHMVNTRQFSTQSNTRDIFYRTNKTGPLLTTRLTENDIDDNYATFGFDQQQNVHIGWERRDASNLFQLMYSNNRSGVFSEAVWITTGGLNKATPYMAVGKNDSLVHFVYYTFATGQDNAYYRWYNYVTGTLGPETVLGPAETGSENDIEIAVDNNNKLHIVYVTNVNVSGGALKYFTNESGTLAEIPTGISANAEYPDIVVDNTNTLHIIYRTNSDKRINLIRKPSGGSLSTPFQITPSGIGNPAYWRAIDTDDNSRLYVTFQNSAAAGPKGYFLVHVTGNTFSSPILIFEDSTGSYVTRGSSSVAAKGNGEVAILFDPAGVRNGVVISDIFMKRGTISFVGIEPISQTASEFRLYNNYPNPFNPVTKIRFDIPSSRTASGVSLKIFDVTGKLLLLQYYGILKSGSYEVSWDASGLSSGVYFYTLNAGEFTATRKMVLVK
jgi:hypothetical protein